MNTEPFSDVVRAFARADWDAAEAVCQAIRDSGHIGNPLVIEAAFALVVNRHFGPDASPTDVAAWVRAARAQYPDRDIPPALETEGLIRAALGEPELVEHISRVAALGPIVFVLGQLLLEANLNAAEVDEFVAEAEELAAEGPGA